MLTKTKLVQSTDSGAKLRSAVVPPLREADCHSVNELCTRTDLPAPQKPGPDQNREGETEEGRMSCGKNISPIFC